MARLEDSLVQLRKQFDTYASLSSATCHEAIAKQSKEFSGFAYQEMKDIAPQAGQIEARLLKHLKGGKGIIVKDERMPNPMGGGDITRPQLVMARLNGTLKNTKKNREVTAGLKAKLQEYAAKMGASNKSASTVTKAAAGNKLGIQALLVQDEIKRRDSHRMFSAISVLFTGDMRTFSTAQVNGKPVAQFTNIIDKNEATGTFSWGAQVSTFSSLAAKVLNTPISLAAINRAVQSTIVNMQVYIDRKLKEQAEGSFFSVK